MKPAENILIPISNLEVGKKYQSDMDLGDTESMKCLILHKDEKYVTAFLDFIELTPELEKLLITTPLEEIEKIVNYKECSDLTEYIFDWVIDGNEVKTFFGDRIYFTKLGID